KPLSMNCSVSEGVLGAVAGRSGPRLVREEGTAAEGSLSCLMSSWAVMIMTLMLMSANVSMAAQACHSGKLSRAELRRALESLATARVLDRVRTLLPCGQAAYEALLSRQLERAGTKAPVEAL